MAVAEVAPVEPLDNPDPNGRLWIVLSNLRVANPQEINPFNRPYIVDYQIANGTPDPTAKYVLHITKAQRIGTFQQYADVPVELSASGSIQFQPPSQFAVTRDIVVTLARVQDRQKWQNLSGELQPGGAGTVADVPPTVLEAAGADATGKTVAIANVQLDGEGPFTTVSIDCQLQIALEPVGYYFVVAEAGDSRVEFDVTRQLKAAGVGEKRH